jgi:hypothetical protein
LESRARKSQLMLAAAMRQHRFFFVIEFSRNDPEIVSALPHPVFLSPYPKSQNAARRPSVAGAAGIGGAKED